MSAAKLIDSNWKCALQKMSKWWAALAFLLMTTSIMATSKPSELVGVKVLPLPDNRVRVLFQLTAPVTKKPTSFTMKSPAKLIMDFSALKNGMPSGEHHKAISIGVLKSYTVKSHF